MRQPNREAEKNLSHKRLQELLDYNPETGEFTWLKSASNRAPKGSRAGCYSDRGGAGRYVLLSIDGHLFIAHRLAWFYVTHVWPEFEIDHKDGDGWNNRINNLRPATPHQNQYNAKLRSNSKTGIKGIAYYPKHAKPYQLWLNQKYIGSYATLDEAKTARERVAKVAHGEFYRAQ